MKKYTCNRTVLFLLSAFIGASCVTPEPEPVVQNVEGRALFYTDVDDGIGNVEVTLAGIKQTCTKVSGIGGPVCGTAGFATFQQPDGTYPFTAKELTSPFRKWSGDVSFTTNACSKWRLKK